jgi:hypothetical protein
MGARNALLMVRRTVRRFILSTAAKSGGARFVKFAIIYLFMYVLSDVYAGLGPRD